MNITGQIRTGKLFCRAVTKIAFESLCHFYGPAVCLEPRFDPIRAYVLAGVGKRKFLAMRTLKLVAKADAHVQPQIGITVERAGPEDFIAYVGLGFPIVVDLSPTVDALDQLFNLSSKFVKANAFIFSDDLLKRASAKGKGRRKSRSELDQ